MASKQLGNKIAASEHRNSSCENASSGLGTLIFNSHRCQISIHSCSVWLKRETGDPCCFEPQPYPCTHHQDAHLHTWPAWRTGGKYISRGIRGVDFGPFLVEKYHAIFSHWLVAVHYYMWLRQAVHVLRISVASLLFTENVWISIHGISGNHM